MKQLNSLVKYCKGLSATIFFRRPNIADSTFSVFTDASHATATEVKSHAGSIIFRSFGLSKGSVAHPIAWSSHKVRRVVRSTLAAETTSCADGFDLAFYINTMAGTLCLDSVIHLFVDSKSLYDLLSTTHDPSELRLKIDLAALREAFEEAHILRLSWVPSKLQLADALTKDNRNAGVVLDCTLSDGRFRDNYADVETKTASPKRKTEG